jgi:uncharacterized DUF497 family protein
MMRNSDFEDRYISIGTSVKGRILLVVHIQEESGNNTFFIRIISSRKATPSERRIYEKAEN